MFTYIFNNIIGALIFKFNQALILSWFAFKFYFVFFFFHYLVLTFMALRLDFAATIQRFYVFGLTSNMLVNKHSDFVALGFLTAVDVIGKLGLPYVNPSGVDTIAAYRISLRFCWSSHLPAC